LGLVLPEFENRFYTEITEAIEYTAQQRGYQVLLCNSRHQPAIEEAHIRLLAEQKVNGVLLAHDPSMPFPPAARMLHDEHIPYVALFTAPAAVSCDSVMVDEYAGITQMLRYLVSLGHRQIAFCRPIAADRPHPRETAYRQFMQQNGWDVPDHFLVPHEAVHNPGGREALRALLARDPAPTALLAGNDRTALLVMKHMAELGISVPQEISVAGFDNLRFTEHLGVPLTTIDQPKREMGRRATELLLERIEFSVASAPRVEVFQPHLIIRESCGVAPALRLSPVA
jgi:LacI family transcriptional regulator